MKVATYNVNSIRPRLPLVLAWIAENKPDVMCVQETKVQDTDFPEEVIKKAGYHASYRRIKAYNCVATLTRKPPCQVIYGLHEGKDNEDFRIVQTVIDGIPIINTYVPQGYSISSDKYALKLAWFRQLRAYFENHLDPKKLAIWTEPHQPFDRITAEPARQHRRYLGLIDTDELSGSRLRQMPLSYDPVDLND